MLRFVFFHTNAYLCVLYYSSVCRQSMELNTTYLWFRGRTAICCQTGSLCFSDQRKNYSPGILMARNKKNSINKCTFKEQLNVSLYQCNKYPNLKKHRSRRVTYTSVRSVIEPQDLLKVKAILSCLISEVTAGH